MVPHTCIMSLVIVLADLWDFVFFFSLTQYCLTRVYQVLRVYALLHHWVKLL